MHRELVILSFLVHNNFVPKGVVKCSVVVLKPQIGVALDTQGLIHWLLAFAMLTLCLLSYLIFIFTNLKLCLASATHSFKWVKITPISPFLTKAYTRLFFFYQHIKYHILNRLKIKCDINQQDFKRVDLHFVKSE